MSAALAQSRRSSRADLKKLAADIRALSRGRRQTASEDLLGESRDEPEPAMAKLAPRSNRSAS